MFDLPVLSFEVATSVFLLYSLFYCVCLLTLFFIFFSIDQKSLVSMPGLGQLSTFFFFRLAAVLVFLALSGMPPLAGFFIKSFFFLVIASRSLALALLFTLFNLMSLYFYLSNTRLLVLNSGHSQARPFLAQLSLAPRALAGAVLLLGVVSASPLFFETALIVSLSFFS